MSKTLLMLLALANFFGFSLAASTPLELFTGELVTPKNESIEARIQVIPDMSYYPTDSKGRFAIPLKPGQFSLYPRSLTHKFIPIRVEVGADLDVTLYQIVPGVEYDTAVPIQTSSGVFRWYAIGENDYYTAKAGFALTGLLFNPMFLLMGFSMLLMFAMPKLMENMEEMVKEEKQAAAVTAPAQNKARATPKK